MFLTYWVALLLARFSLRWANRWLAYRGSGMRFYRSVRIFVNGHELHEEQQIDFPQSPPR